MNFCIDCSGFWTIFAERRVYNEVHYQRLLGKVVALFLTSVMGCIGILYGILCIIANIPLSPKREY